MSDRVHNIAYIKIPITLALGTLFIVSISPFILGHW